MIGLRTFSKMYGLAGLRVGFGVADPAVIALMNQARSPFNVNLAAQVAGTAAINDTAFVAKSLQTNTDGLTQFYRGFERMGLSYIPSYANFVLVDTQKPCREVFTALLKQGIIVRTGDIFGLPTFLRVTVGTAAQNDRFLHTLKKVLQTIPSGTAM